MNPTDMTTEELDRAVAQLLGPDYVWMDAEGNYFERTDAEVDPRFTPCTNWAQAGPIIDGEQISVMLSFQGSHAEGANARPTGWCARKYQYGVLNEPLSYGSTPLIAAMRCFVAAGVSA